MCKSVQPLPEKQKSHEIFRFTASTLDIPSRWDPRAKQSRTVALLAALCAAALFEPFHRADKKKNQNTNVFWFFLVHLAHSYPNFSPLSQLPRKRPFLYLPYS